MTTRAEHRAAEGAKAPPLAAAALAAIEVNRLLLPVFPERLGLGGVPAADAEGAGDLPEAGSVTFPGVAVAGPANGVSDLVEQRLVPLLVAHVEADPDPVRRSVGDEPPRQAPPREGDLRRADPPDRPEALVLGPQMADRLVLGLGGSARKTGVARSAATDRRANEERREEREGGRGESGPLSGTGRRGRRLVRDREELELDWQASLAPRPLSPDSKPCRHGRKS
jgi:hypothetical protein